MRVYWTHEARSRLQEIETRIAKDSPQNAPEVVRRLVQRTRDLASLPQLGRRVPEYPDAELRELLERPFRLIYRVGDEQVYIMTVMHYRQLLPRDWRDVADST
jgi:plasmid stabilization system protein ParE